MRRRWVTVLIEGWLRGKLLCGGPFASMESPRAERAWYHQEGRKVKVTGIYEQGEGDRGKVRRWVGVDNRKAP